MSIDTTIVARAGIKPTAKQVYAICRLTLDLAGLDWPADRAQASALIGTLRGAQAPAAQDAVPF